METLKSNKARLEYLINDMRRERNDNDVLVMPSSFEDLWELYRGLANVRPALPVSDEYLAVQDAMLSDLNRQHVTDLKDLKPIKGDNIFVWQGDITTLKIDAIVNAANSRFLGCSKLIMTALIILFIQKRVFKFDLIVQKSFDNKGAMKV